MERLRTALPRGHRLPEAVFARRHRGILLLLWLHVPVLFAMALARGETVGHSASEAGALAAIAALATVAGSHRTLSTILTSVGLMSCSAELVHLSGGLIEMHFHFFVMVGVVTLYQEWRPFLVAIGYVLIHHGVAGVIEPSAVYDHPAALASPLRWAAVHAGFILAISAVGVVSWRLNESLLDTAAEREARLAEAQAIAKVGSWDWRAGRGATWSREMYLLLGVDESFPIDGASIAALVHPDDRAAWWADIGGMAVPGGVHDQDYRMIRPDGTVRWFHGRGRVTARAGDEIVAQTGTIQDITERKRNEEALLEADRERRDALSRLEATFESTADGILAVALDGTITGWNRRFASMWNVSDELLAQGVTAVVRHLVDHLTEPDDFVAIVDRLDAPELLTTPASVELRDGRVIERVSLPQRVDGEIVGRVWSFRDVTDRTRLQEELSHQAFHDALTGLANQALFRDRLEHAVARRRSGRLAVLFIDLDNFKHVNDSLGHPAGDELLVQVTARILDTVRSADTAARHGGDEFAVLLEDLDDSEEAERIAARLLEVLRRPFRVAGKDVFTTASIGIAADVPADVPAGGPVTADQLIRNADLAMYSAKRLGRDRIEAFAPEMHSAVVDRLDLESDLRRARVSDELRIEYQPIIYLETGEIASVEALVRWQHPGRGLLGPDTFIPFAEESGLIDEIGLWVLEQACAQVRRWHDLVPDHPPIGVSVNLSPRQLRDDQILSTIDATLTAAGLDPGHLTLEITETAMMHDTEVALARLHELKALGVRLAIDDFGTGYSSLNYLQQFPIDIIKVDRAFVERTDQGVEESSLARAIIRLAQSMRLATVAEGVENEAQMAWLRSVGCTGAQGFHVSRPVDADHIGRLLVAGEALWSPMIDV